MKSKSILAVIALLASFFILACAYYCGERPANEALYGTWNWKSSSGGHTGKQIITPETAGYTKRIRFSPEGEYQEFHDGNLVITARYSVVTKRTIFRSNTVLCFSDTTGRLGDKVIMGVTATSLDLSDPNPDGFWHAYIRVGK